MRTTSMCFRRTPLLAAAACTLFHCATSDAVASTSIDADIRQSILNCTFEVLAPMRDSAVRVAGTAFCLGDGELATAAHVFDQILGGRFEAPVVRDRHGRVYAIDRILRYSMPNDFVVFSIVGAPSMSARPHIASNELSDSLYLAWRRSDGNIAFDRTQFRDFSTVADLGRDGWIQFGPAPDHGASGAALYDDAGRIVGLINGRTSEHQDASGFAVPIALIDAASTQWADIAMRDPLRLLGMPSTRNLPLRGGIPLPASYERFERHMIDVRNTYYAHMLPYSLSLSGDNAPIPDTDRANLCAALGADYCPETPDFSHTLTREKHASRDCRVIWTAASAALVRCSTDAALTTTSQRFAQPPPPCSSQDALGNAVATDTFTDHTGAKWALHARPVSGCDWVILSLTRKVPNGTLTFVRGAPSAYMQPAAMQLKALTAIQNTTTAAPTTTPTAQQSVLAEATSVKIEVTR